MDYITANNIITRIGNQMESHKNRPLGVTIIAVLSAIGGIIFLGSGAVVLVFGIGIILAIISIAAGNI